MSGVGRVPSVGTAVQADLAGLNVTPDTVLQLHNALRAEVQYLRDQTRVMRADRLVGKPGLDPVSEWAASDEGFNGKIKAMVQRCEEYHVELDRAADQLAQTARAYGHTEEEIAASFDGFYPGYAAAAGESGRPLLRPSPESLAFEPLGPYLPPEPPPKSPGDMSPLLAPPPGPGVGPVTRWLVCGALAAMTAGLIAACGMTTPSTAAPAQPAAPSRESALGPRPAVLRLENVDPCMLLTSAEIAELRVPRAKPELKEGDQGGRGCQWSTTSKPYDSWLAIAILGRSADYFLGSVTGAQRTQIGGFPALHTTGAFANPDESCGVVIDVAPGQALDLDYEDYGKNRPGMNHEMACQMADRVAAMMLANLARQVR